MKKGFWAYGLELQSLNDASRQKGSYRIQAAQPPKDWADVYGPDAETAKAIAIKQYEAASRARQPTPKLGHPEVMPFNAFPGDVLFIEVS